MTFDKDARVHSNYESSIITYGMMELHIVTINYFLAQIPLMRSRRNVCSLKVKDGIATQPCSHRLSTIPVIGLNLIQLSG